MEKQMIFMSGLPRSGSTLLCNILAQNPEIFTSATSSLIDVVTSIKNGWNQLAGMRAMSIEKSNQHLKNALLSLLYGYYANQQESVIIDKSRGWLAFIPTIEAITGQKAKIIVTVRDLRGVMASVEKLYRKTDALSVVPGQLQYPQHFINVQTRVTFWADGRNLVGSCLNLIRAAQEQHLGDRMHFVDYKYLCQAPKATLEGIYNFIEQPNFVHDFDNVQQFTTEDDRVHGWFELHTIRPKVEYPPQDFNDVLGQSLADSLKGQECW